MYPEVYCLLLGTSTLPGDSFKLKAMFSLKQDVKCKPQHPWSVFHVSHFKVLENDFFCSDFEVNRVNHSSSYANHFVKAYVMLPGFLVSLGGRGLCMNIFKKRDSRVVLIYIFGKILYFTFKTSLI